MFFPGSFVDSSCGCRRCHAVNFDWGVEAEYLGIYLFLFCSDMGCAGGYACAAQAAVRRSKKMLGGAAAV